MYSLRNRHELILTKICNDEYLFRKLQSYENNRINKTNKQKKPKKQIWSNMNTSIDKRVGMISILTESFYFICVFIHCS